jgi:uncharacterized membrane protein
MNSTPIEQRTELERTWSQHANWTEPTMGGQPDTGRRLDSIDLLRGLVMVLMALDHTRDFFGTSAANPRDVAEPALFLTRWITHFCAPTFIFLAGVSAYLYGSRARSTSQVSRFLFTRGLWLIVLEFTLVRVAWRFSLQFNSFPMLVIWALGASMVALAVLIHLPRWALIVIALGMIGGHNLLDGVHAVDLGSAGWLWTILHERGVVRIGETPIIFVLYPLVPWIGVMAAGFALGPVFKLERGPRLRWLTGLGLLTTAGFVVLRATNLYGDPAVWTVQSSLLATLLSFINCEKYPPSLLYLAMTLGPALLLLAAFERARGKLAQWITVFGRVPLFYYVTHLFLIHALAVIFAVVVVGDATWLFGGRPIDRPAAFGLGLPGIYVVWLFVVLALYPLCRWFAALKQRRREWWWSYL